MLAAFSKSNESNGGPSMLTHIRVLVVVLLRRSVLILFIVENVCSQAAGLHAIQEVLNDPQIKFKEAKDVRWLSHANANAERGIQQKIVYLHLLRRTTSFLVPICLQIFFLT